MFVNKYMDRKDYIRSFVSTIGFSFIFALTVSSVQAMEQEETDHQIHTRLLGKIEKLPGDFDIYVGAGFSPAGEPLFYGKERVDGRNYATWSKYADDTRIIIKLLSIFRSDCEYFKEPHQYAKEPWITWYNCKDKDYQNNLMALMKPKYKKLWDIFGELGTWSGVSAFNQSINDSGNTYVSYISNKSIKGNFKPNLILDKNNVKNTNCSLKNYQEAYKNMIMSSVFDCKPSFSFASQQGTFKNPFYEIEGLYKKTSLSLYGWGGIFAEDILEGKDSIHVMPTTLMGNILEAGFSPEDLTIDTSVLTDEGRGLYSIKIKALSKMYLDCSKGI